jgi:hypothetical protein
MFKRLKNKLIKDDVITIGETVTSSLVLKEERYEKLHQYLTPKLEQWGLKYVRDNVWLSEENKLGIRKMVKYDYNGTNRATLAWGVCLTFLPLPSGGKLVYQRTNSNSKLHLFEWADEFKYYTNLTLNDTDKGSIYHEKHRFENDLKRVVNEELPNIIHWFKRAETINNLIDIAEEQIKNNWLFHFPSQHYVLSFLYAKNGNKTKALELLNKCIDNESIQIHLDKISTKLMELTNKVTTLHY